MGWTYEVSAWVEGNNGYYDHIVYAGNSLFEAIREMRIAKRNSGCVTFKWR